MRRLLVVLTVLLLPAWAVPAQAQLLFKKQQPRPTASQRVPELILTLKTDADERKRARAAEELREFDARAYSEIVPVLVDVLTNDRQASVRLEALNTLTRLRPVSQAAGAALEHAAAGDESWRVRLQAKSALVKYHLAGYSSNPARTDLGPGFPTTQEPPLADPVPPPAAGTPAPVSLIPAAPRTLPQTMQPTSGTAPLRIESPPLDRPF